ncbi:hypothetical protein [Amycolatopsis sp.]|uniref:hypothetical protein n=1 Tax=Amycolatopsis sp. TaxID=37632 RepID=UPI002D7FA4CE|nr:hypothetical protein [Amycolatopsis sp.]HET6707100.1 hypothetical protein [Amycolatopsis sp.]
MSSRCSAEISAHDVSPPEPKRTGTRFCAKVIAGLESAAHQRIERALDWQDEPEE